jgi:glycosyltransferase involved in cell wall biosynthesis
MRLLYLLTTLGIGGAERQTLMLAERMAARGHDVALLVLQPPRENQWPTTLRTVHLGMAKNPPSVLRGLARGAAFLHSFRPDLLHSHTFPANLAARLLRLTRPQAKLVSTLHNIYEGGLPRRVAYRLTDPLSSITTAVSRAAAESAIAGGAVARRKCTVLVNGIDVDALRANEDRRTEQRAAMGARSEFVWLAAGRVTPAKDYPNLLRAFARVRALRPQSQLWIAGEAAPGAVEAVRAAANEPGCFEQVRWLGLRRDLPALMDAADGFVLSSAWEGLPLAAGEAMAMEKVVVATEVGGVRQLVGSAGAVVAPGSPAALAGAMLDAMRLTAEERSALGRRARQRIVERFSMETAAARWEELYLRLLRRV